MSGHRSHVTTHVLDATSGKPAVGVAITLQDADGAEIASGVTDADGRISDFGPAELPTGVYRVTFATGAYFAATGTATFFPEVQIAFSIDDPAAHFHIPLLLSPFAYSTYRGS